jgi:biotin carboxyl carrier protein
MAEHTVTTPVPGIFYRSPDPDSPPFAEVGSAISAGDTIGLVEVLKNYQEVEAEVGGTLTAFCVEDRATVAAGESVATIDAG